MSDWIAEHIALIWHWGDGVALIILISMATFVMALALSRIQHHRGPGTIYRWGMATILISVIGVMLSFAADRHAALSANDIARVALTMIAGVGTSLVATSATAGPISVQRPQPWLQQLRGLQARKTPGDTKKAYRCKHHGEPQRSNASKINQDPLNQYPSVFELAHQAAPLVLEGSCAAPIVRSAAGKLDGRLGVPSFNLPYALPVRGSVTLQARGRA